MTSNELAVQNNKVIVQLSRAKRVLRAITILIVLVFGGISAYWFYYEKVLNHAYDTSLIDRLVTEHVCERYKKAAACSQVENITKISNNARFAWRDAVMVAQVSLGIAVGIPITLWTFFFLFRWNLMSKRVFRLWLAGSAVWALAVGAWYLIFRHVSEMGEEEYFFLVFTPPGVAAFAVAAWGWAVRRP